MKTLLLTLTYLVGAGELVLAWYFWKTNSGNEIRKVMAFLALVTALWVITTASITYTEPSAAAQVRSDFVYSFGILIVTALFHFALVFPWPTLRLDWLHYVLLYGSAVIFGYINFITNDIVAQFISSATLSGKWLGGPLFPLYNSYLLLAYLAALFILFKKYKRSDGIHRINLRIVLWSVIIGGAPAVIADLVVPLLFQFAIYPLIGTLSTVFWLGGTAYILVRK